MINSERLSTAATLMEPTVELNLRGNVRPQQDSVIFHPHTSTLEPLPRAAENVATYTVKLQLASLIFAATT